MYQKCREALEKAYQVSARATEKEQLLIRAWYSANILKDKQITLDLLLELLEKIPREKEAHYCLRVLYYDKDMKEKAIEQFRRFLEPWQATDRVFKEPDDTRKRFKRIAINA